MDYDHQAPLPDPELNPEFYADTPAKRFFAWLVDGVLIFLVTLAVLPFTAFTGIFFYPLLWLVISFAYRTVTLASGSATWGMRLMSLEMRTHRGERFGLGEAFIHTLVYSFAISTFFVQAISIVLMLATPRRQSLGDHLLGSVALNRAAARR
ncbi:MAG: RDD family protein [Vannielia sp.]|uniref:RDD family protein n=1 Tax=Rhodobacterales TaxID=204455 RepID=UPI00209461FB|nr:RDD family protein [Oceanicola sp. 502str15]MCO6382220.1 RDD family protein [Oceanicola sp. 502str15]